MTYSAMVVDMFKAPLKESKHTVGGFATLELAREYARRRTWGSAESNVVDTPPAPTRSKGGGFSSVKIARSLTIRSITRGCRTWRTSSTRQRRRSKLAQNQP
jgi:hypothetical protein